MDDSDKDPEVSNAASVMGKKRWADMSEEQRKVAMEKARAERQRKVPKKRRREIAVAAINARWARVRAAKEAGEKADEAKDSAPSGRRRKRGS